MEPGIYDENGEKNPNGRLFLGMGSGIVHIWGVFKNGLEPGQTGEMRFHNVPGSYVVTGNFSEWIPGPAGYSPHAILRHDVVPPPDLSKMQPAEIEEGIWDLKVRVHTAPGAPPDEVTGLEEIMLMPTASPHAWAISKYKAIFRGQPFEQHGILGYDANKERHAGAWVKTVQANLGVFEGDYDARTRTLVLDGIVESCVGARDKFGKFIKIREKRIIHYLTRTSKTMKVFQQEPDQDGNFGPGQPWVLKDEITASRRREIAPYPGNIMANVPTISDGIMTLIALQRAKGEIKVVGRNTSNAHRNAVAGMVKLGPSWETAFHDALRL
jgi:hypothetical protein